MLPRDVLVVINTGGVTFSALRIDIDSQTTFDGFYRIGAIEIGNVFPFGEQYGRGRIIEGIPGTVVDDAADNARRKTDRAPGYRTARFAWTFPTEQSDLFGPTPDPDYLQASTTSGNGPVAAANDVGFSMQYMLMQHGAGRPFIYLPSIIPSTTSGGDVIVFNPSCQPGQAGTRGSAPVCVAFRVHQHRRHPESTFRGSIPRLWIPLSTLRRAPCGNTTHDSGAAVGR